MSAASSGSSGNVESPIFPEAFFLDTDLFNSVSHSALRRSAYPVPAQVSHLIESDANAICKRYFETIDGWFPFVSMKRLSQDIQASLPSEAAGLALSLLCMKLATDNPQLNNIPASESELYRTARSYLNTIEEMSPVSLYVLQSLVLIALYEIGHGIFPAAYLTVGRAARLGILMGIHERKNSTQLFTVPKTWTYWEEERRTWWAVMILERYVNLGPTGLPLATPEPAQEDLLPTADSEWSQGRIGANQALYTSDFSSDSEIGPYARVCQASHILGRVVNHRNRRKDEMAREFILEEALQLSATLTALDKHLSRPMDELHADETITLVDVALCTSARLALYNMYACNQANVQNVHPERLPKESTIQIASIAGIKQVISTRGAAIAWHVLRQGTTSLDGSSPIVIHCLYDAATECAWFVREGDIVEGAASTLQLLVQALTLLAGRWAVAS
ncbi:hypothetical protein K505DRAFT_357400 [Melanomma pulvis-pyrius CBS 109.77]|uniref:Xylanolytic transcriptional activator regulatory domain-containing protein n=1 Tax=Melanomma pulvis-pyrius CBS 109.77 TaxID=1314802 RepID=A0A6A6XQP0_9PLEO|nr:hypothetical protein K505DRAFT_357400 [Melanomma pulvis-pyrius CBS 109.77]